MMYTEQTNFETLLPLHPIIAETRVSTEPYLISPAVFAPANTYKPFRSDFFVTSSLAINKNRPTFYFCNIQRNINILVAESVP